uniref:Uncharacterized protein n=1 Tax=Arundo donax TaxID=35708 RepID=A0A0A9FAC6_ARUDO
MHYNVKSFRKPRKK